MKLKQVKSTQWNITFSANTAGILVLMNDTDDSSMFTREHDSTHVHGSRTRFEKVGLSRSELERVEENPHELDRLRGTSSRGLVRVRADPCESKRFGACPSQEVRPWPAARKIPAACSDSVSLPFTLLQPVIRDWLERVKVNFKTGIEFACRANARDISLRILGSRVSRVAAALSSFSGYFAQAPITPRSDRCLAQLEHV